MEFAAVIGLEVHAQLRTATKLFCGCRADYGAPPNSRTCPVCLGLPGVLPVLNARAVEFALRLGVAVEATIARRSLFARKNYFYPDLPKGYQISQYELPVCTDGRLAIRVGGGTRSIGIERIHLEEDAGKSLHGAGATRLDFNRAGVPLLEIVSRPELRSGEEAHAYLTRLRQLLVYLEICDGNLEEGSLRCDANVSIRTPGVIALGPRTEIKNLNSLRGVWKAIDYELARHGDIVRGGGRVAQATCGWDAAAGRTVFRRAKEAAHDYRYFPEPDLPPLLVTEEELAAVNATLPELPHAREARLGAQYDLPPADAARLADSRPLADYFEATAAALGDGRAAANWILAEALRYVNEAGGDIAAFPVAPAGLAALLALVRDGTLSGRIAKEVFAEMVATGAAAAAIVAARGLRQESDAAPLAAAAAAVLDAHPRQVADYLAGRTKLFGFFVGELMRATGGRANPELANRLLAEALARRS
ncbi:MAG: Asp-tRNA(Asn)/Glu-tRNA(Gln) amidotransferase subunit GatB [Candidatus Krumholzibacteriia bacterium]